MTAAAKQAKIAALMKVKITVGLVLAAIVIAAVLIFFPRQTAPEVRFTALSGESFSTSELRGKVVLVNFWASYCAPCIQEMPKIVDTHRKFAPRGFETVAVAVRQDNPGRVAHFAASRALPFKVALDSSGEVAKRFGNVRITPTSFLIDKQGHVLKRYRGAPDWAEFHEIVERALAS
jgi:peroxiredoxin